LKKPKMAAAAAGAGLPGLTEPEAKTSPDDPARGPAGEGRGISAEALRSLAALRAWLGDDTAFAELFGGGDDGRAAA
jgi:hypothetical protein